MANEADAFPRDAQGRLVKPEAVRIEGERMTKETDKLMEALRQARPGSIARLQQRSSENDSVRRTDFPQGSVIHRPQPADFPPKVGESVSQQGKGLELDCSFLLRDRTSGDSNKVLIMDGKINGAFPAGMGAGNYVLDLAVPEDALIYAGVTFNPTTNEITSRFMGESTAAEFPESRAESTTSGFLYWMIGFTYFNAAGRFKIYQTRLGDINFAITYGAFNGNRALLPVDSSPGWIDLAFA